MRTAAENADVIDLLVDLIDAQIRELTPRGRDALDPLLDLRNDVTELGTW